MSILQIKASDPTLSTWVSASAGSGKTKILTDRVLRLLLKSIPFNKILCLTFTNNAANEMQERIISHLEKWSNSNLQELELSLANTLGRKPFQDEVIKASLLFKSYLKTQDQINIYTVHSFCQKILKKFPLEAGISPNFKIIDEFKVKQIITDVKKQIFNLLDIEPITRFFIENFHELTIDDIFNDIISIKTKILEKKLNLSETSADPIVSGLEYIEALSNHDSNIYADIITNNEIRNYFTKLNDNKPLSAINLKPFFLTSQDEKKKRIVTKKIASPDSDFYKELEILQEKIYQIDQYKKTEYLILYSKLLLILAEKFIYQFEAYKKKNTFLDYDDLIIYTQNLLTNSYAKEWVLYKLDGGIEHLLVDEAQDTSKNQWCIIEALVEEFYAGESKNHENRTIFVVGDEKQSIFSFQGADISSFSYMNKFLNKKLLDGGKDFNNIDLNVSYRSTKEILACVDDVFCKIAKNTPEDFTATLTNMIAHREKHTGLVELWPLSLDENDDISNEFWSLPSKNNLNSGKFILAKKIANYVKEQIDSGKILYSTNKKISAQDFMIIFRTRDDFTNEVIKALRKVEIDITGLDRISLAEDLAIADIISILNFVLNRDNDLNIAALLKSPIFSISEKELYNIVIEAKKNNISIWKYLKIEKQYSFIKNELEKFIDLYKNLPLSNFFFYITDVLDYRKLVTNNGEVIDEFLKLVKNYLSEYGNSLQEFIYWFQSNQITIKKDTDAKNKIRIMTAHAAKGLQAPIVILCDTTKLPNLTERFVWNEQDQLLSAKSSSYIPEFYKTLKTKEQKKAYQEYLRLLYVAMTRAEDNLIICGYQSRNNLSDNCWYQLVKNSMQEMGFNDSNHNLIYGGTNEIIEDLIEKDHEKEVISDKIFKPIGNWELKESFYKSDASMKNEISYNKSLLLEYGIVFHKILEDVVKSKNLNDVNNHPLIKTLDIKLQKKMKNSLEKLGLNNQFQELLQYNLKTEVSFGYKINSEVKIGRVDLLVIKEDQIIIIDYKSGNKSGINQIPHQYLHQLKGYKDSFTEIYPNKKIICKIIWLERAIIQDVLV